MRTLLAILLASLPAAAQVPGGHVYFGVGGSWMVPLASDSGHVWKSAQQSFAPSLTLAHETQHTLVALDLEYGGFSGWPDYGIASLRGGWIFGSGSTAPYLALGAGIMHMNAESHFDCVNGSCDVASGSGGAVLAEAGVLFFRHLRVGRVALSVRAIEPLFGIKVSYQPQTDTLPLLLFTLRILG